MPGGGSYTSDPFRTIIDSLPILAWTARPDGSVEYFNRQWLEYTGANPTEALDWGWTPVFHPDDIERVTSYWLAVLASGEAAETEARMRRADGVYRWFLIRASAQRDDSGRIVRWYGTNTDIEQRRCAEQALRNSEEQLRLIVATLPGFVYTSTATGEVEFVNEPLLRYVGKSLEELQAWQTADVIHPEDLPNTIAVAQKGFAAAKPFDFEERLRGTDGSYRWFHLRIAPLLDPQGAVVRWYGLLTDVDDVKRAGDALRASEARLALLVDNIPGMIYTRDGSGRLEFVNRRLLDYFERSFEELQGWQTSDLLHPEDLPRAIGVVQEGLRTGRQTEIEMRVRRADGSHRWCHFRHVPVHDADGRIHRWYCLVTDVDDLKRAEETLRATQARLSKATHLASLSELAASIAHEINQPLAAVVANGHACQRWLGSSPPNVERAVLSAERIIRDANGAAEVIQRIRSLFGRVPPKKDLLNFNDVIQEVHHLMADEFRRRGVILAADLQAGLPVVAADRVQMQQVLTNLTKNAIEAMESLPPSERRLDVRSRWEATEVVVEVSDQGPGFDASQSLFDAFFTTKADGMGMGLTICRSIIDAHGGRIWARPREPRGASFGFAIGTTSGQVTGP